MEAFDLALVKKDQAKAASYLVSTKLALDKALALLL